LAVILMETIVSMTSSQSFISRIKTKSSKAMRSGSPVTGVMPNGPFKGEFRLGLRPDGGVVVPDLVPAFIPVASQLGGDPSLWADTPCVVERPNHLLAKSIGTGIDRCQLAALKDADLWDAHQRVMRPSPPQTLAEEECTLLELKAHLATRLLRDCSLCERHCGVNRLAGEAGFCGLGPGLQVGAYSMLYNEGPLVGAPSFGVFLRGCSLRCNFCYRPDELRARGREELSPHELAVLLDEAARTGATSWHFLGGNPDESLPGILQALLHTTTALPVVWNSALQLTPAALSLLIGVADIWLPDWKFGNDRCAREIAGVECYTATIRRNLAALRHEPLVVVRHMRLPGHEQCCTRPVLAELSDCHPAFLVHLLTHHTPPANTAKRRSG
jgi:putative pyruvate formate lyase activating enzyme